MENHHEGFSQLGTQTHISVKSCNETLRQCQGYSKSFEAFSSQCSDEKIVQFFKCSRRACDFTCEDKESFYCHLLTHNEYEEQDCCIYCERVFVIENLAQHMVSQHGNRRFQCKLCFYRGCTRAHLIIHSLNVHSSMVVQGLACPRMSGALMPDVKPRARTLLYRCSLCSFRAFGRVEFCSHLRECHPYAQHFCCAYCKHIFDSTEFIKHFRSVHNFQDLTCLYCGATFFDDQEAFVHMVELHSDWPINILDRNSSNAYQTSVDLNNSSPEVEKVGEETNFNQVPFQCPQCSAVFGYSEALRLHDCPALNSPAKNTISTMGMSITTTMNSTTKQQTSSPAVAAATTAAGPQSKRYSAAPKSVLEKRKKETNGILSSTATMAPLEEPPKRSSLSRRKKKSECIVEQPLPIVAQKPVACAVCSVRGFRLEYSTREELALHMLEEHRCIYICNRCFHGEEKFKNLQNHVKICEGAVEKDILTIKNGMLQTSSKVKVEKHQKDKSIAKEKIEREKHEPVEYKSYYGRPVEAVDDAVVVVCEDGSRFPMKTFLLLVPQQRLELQKCTWEEMRRWGAVD